MNTDNNEDAQEELSCLLEIVHALSEYHEASIEKVEEIRKLEKEKR